MRLRTARIAQVGEIDSRRQQCATLVARVPFDLIRPRCVRCIHQRPYGLTQHIVDHQLTGPGLDRW